MCPWTDLRATAGSMPIQTFARIQPHLSQAESVDLTGGGEPLKNPFLTDMILAAKQSGCEVGFSTNGVLLNSNLAERLVTIGLDWISFSVDAARPDTYDRIRQGARFDAVMENIAAVRDAKRRMHSVKPRMMMVFVMMTGQHENYHELVEYIDLAHTLGVETIIAKNLDVILKDGDDERRLFTHNGHPQSEVESVLNQAEKRAGELGITLRKYNLSPQEQVICEHDPIHNLYVNWEGYISPCISLSYAENRVFNSERVQVPCQRFGNILDNSLDEIWEKPAYREFRQAYESRLLARQRQIITASLSGSATGTGGLPPAPEGCQTCYYLYGI